MNSSIPSGPRNVVLAAMIFAVAMTLVNQTIVSIAAPARLDPGVLLRQ